MREWQAWRAAIPHQPDPRRTQTLDKKEGVEGGPDPVGGDDDKEVGSEPARPPKPFDPDDWLEDNCGKGQYWDSSLQQCVDILGPGEGDVGITDDEEPGGPIAPGTDISGNTGSTGNEGGGRGGGSEGEGQQVSGSAGAGEGDFSTSMTGETGEGLPEGAREPKEVPGPKIPGNLPTPGPPKPPKPVPLLPGVIATAPPVPLMIDERIFEQIDRLRRPTKCGQARTAADNLCIRLICSGHARHETEKYCSGKYRTKAERDECIESVMEGSAEWHSMPDWRKRKILQAFDALLDPSRCSGMDQCCDTSRRFIKSCYEAGLCAFQMCDTGRAGPPHCK